MYWPVRWQVANLICMNNWLTKNLNWEFMVVKEGVKSVMSLASTFVNHHKLNATLTYNRHSLAFNFPIRERKKSANMWFLPLSRRLERYCHPARRHVLVRTYVSTLQTFVRAISPQLLDLATWFFACTFFVAQRCAWACSFFNILILFMQKWEKLF